MARAVTVALCAGILFTFGCAQGAPTSSGNHAATQWPQGLGPASVQEGVGQAALAIYEVTIDPQTLTAESALVATRSGAANDDVHDLEVSRFLTPDSFRVEGVKRGVGTLDLTYRFAHPFAAPSDMTPPGSGAHRADLGAAIRMMFLLDADPSSPSFFAGDGDIRASLGLLTNADGYAPAGGLFAVDSSYIANVFPYQILVDEALDNRAEVSNGGDMRGNADDDAFGWQAANIDNNGINNGWVGMGMLFQGQSATRVAEFDAVALGTSPMKVQVVVLAKYGQPKSAKVQKLPATPPDVTVFGYRYNHIALDLETVEFRGESGGGFIANQPSASDLAFTVRDWDYGAPATALTDLALDPDPAAVAYGYDASSPVDFSIPEILGTDILPITTVLDDDTGYNPVPDPDRESGIPNDAIVYRETISKLPGTGEVAGPKWGMLRVIDPGEAIGSGEWHKALDQEGNPIAHPPVITYQVFQVNLQPEPLPDPGWAVHFGGTSPDTAADVAVDPMGNIYVTGIYYLTGSFVTGLSTALGSHDAYLTKLASDGSLLWHKSIGGTSPDWGEALAVDSVGNVILAGNTYSQVDFGGGLRTPPTYPNTFGDIFLVKYSPAGAWVWDRNYGTGSAERVFDVAVDPADNVAFAGYFNGTTLNFGGGALTSGADGGYVTKLDSAGTFQWNYTVGSPNQDRAHALTTDSLGNVIATGYFFVSADFGGGTVPSNGSQDIWVRKMSPAGGYLWSRTYGGASQDVPESIASNSTTGALALAGTFFQTIDFGGGPRTYVSGTDLWVLHLDSAGVYGWDRTYGTTFGEGAYAVAIDPTGNVLVGGEYGPNIDFGGGPRTMIGARDAFILKLSPAGTYVWDTTFGGTSTDTTLGLDTDASGEVYGSGTFYATVDFEPGAGVTDVTSYGSSDGFAIRLHGADGLW